MRMGTIFTLPYQQGFQDQGSNRRGAFPEEEVRVACLSALPEEGTRGMLLLQFRRSVKRAPNTA